MAAPTIDQIPEAGQPSDPKKIFDQKMYAHVNSLNTFVDQLNAFGEYIGVDIDIGYALRTPELIAALPNAAGRADRIFTFSAGGVPTLMSADAFRSYINVADGATANSTDAQLRDRATHTGVQPISSVTNLQSSLDLKLSKSSVKADLSSPNNNDAASTLAVASAIAAVSSGETPKGAWNAATNTPALASGVGTAGWYYEVSVAGTTNLNGETGWQVGDKAIFNGSSWSRIPASAVVSINGKQGTVVTEVNTVADLADLSPSIGDKISTKGCLSVGDGGHGTFDVVASTSLAVDGYSVIEHPNGLFSVLRGTFFDCSPNQFGAFGNGVADDGDALRRFIARFGSLRVPPGIGYAYTGELLVAKNNSAVIGDGSGVSKLIPLTLTGKSLNIARANGPLRGFTLSGITIQSPASGVSGSALHMDGVRNFSVYDVVIDRGYRGLHIAGCSQGNFDNLTIIMENDNGVNTGRGYVYIEETANSNIGSKHPGDVFFTNFNGRCGSIPYCSAGIEIHSADGIWFSNYHVGNCTSTNIHINADRAARCTGIKFTNGWHDIGTGSGTIIEGSTPSTIGQYQFDNVRSLGGNTGQRGYDISGSANNIKIGGTQSRISGYQQQGVRVREGFTGSIEIDNTDIADCSLVGLGVTDAVVYQATSGTLKMSGGKISGSNHRWSINVQNPMSALRIKNVDVATGTSGAINYTPTAGNVVQDNPGYNPSPHSVLSVGASPYTYTNTTGYPVAISVGGGTVTLVQKNGATLTGKTSVDTVLANGQSLTITYSSAPNVSLFGM